MAESDISDSDDIGSLEVRSDNEAESESESESESNTRRAIFFPSGITQFLHKHLPRPG